MSLGKHVGLLQVLSERCVFRLPESCELVIESLKAQGLAQDVPHKGVACSGSLSS